MVSIERMRYYPPEWKEHRSTWFSFPHNLNEWNEARLEFIQDWFISLYDLVLDYEDIDLICADEELLARAENKLERLKAKKYQLRTHVVPNNDIWIRDYGPFFVKNENKTEILDFGFNAWGEKFPPWDLDNLVPKFMSDNFSYPSSKFEMIMEGGSLEFNGEGLIMTSEQCLLNKNRNPSMTKSEIEEELKSAFNINEVIWLKDGLEGDHTDGHIDDFARFVSADTVMLCKAKPDDVNYERLVENRKILEDRSLKIIDLPLPKVMTIDGERLPNSYANFIFVNGAVVVPVFNCPEDEIALNIFEAAFPDRKIVSIDSTLLIEEGGGLHCASKQEPA